MLAPDDKNSVLSQVSGAGRKARAYSAYGYSADDATTDSGLGYNGELRDSTTGHYILGKGYRVFSPQMMRFYSPDSWSPFGEGGVNAYGYVAGNPVKFKDPTGHVLKGILKLTQLVPEDVLAGWKVTTVNGSTIVPGTASNVAVSRNIASRSADIGQSASDAVKRLDFEDTIEVFEYKQRMDARHWTKASDVKLAIDDLDAHGGMGAFDDFLYGHRDYRPLAEPISTEGDAIRKGWETTKAQKTKRSTKKSAKKTSVLKAANQRSLQ